MRRWGNEESFFDYTMLYAYFLFAVDNLRMNIYIV